MISPILTYNSEIWGVYAKPDFKTWDGSQVNKKAFYIAQRRAWSFCFQYHYQSKHSKIHFVYSVYR